MVRLRQLLGERMKDYARAHYQFDTSGQDAEVALDGLLELASECILPPEPDGAG